MDAEVLSDMTESSYIALVQWTGEQARSDKSGKLNPLTEQGSAASAEALMAKAAELGQVWI